MTHNIFFVSDTHFGHDNILKFTKEDGSRLRDFSSIEEMHEVMVERWNSIVRPVDKVYHLGDVVIAQRHLPILNRLNGKKRLVRGNHDIFKTKEYLNYFSEVYGVRAFGKEGFICSHIPIHTDSMYRWKLNVHGHLHGNVVKSEQWVTFKDDLGKERGTHEYLPDPKYYCVSVEQIDYTPVSLEQVMQRIPK
jgi:calcineurin-like phosphoesterase family protein